MAGKVWRSGSGGAAGEYHAAPFLASERCCYYLKSHATTGAKARFAARRLQSFPGKPSCKPALDLKVPVPKECGKMVRDPDGLLRTTKAQRTGGTMCGFGVHLEGRSDRFDGLRESNPKEWEFWMQMGTGMDGAEFWSISASNGKMSLARSAWRM